MTSHDIYLLSPELAKGDRCRDSAFGIVLAAGYILWMIQRTYFGKIPDRYEQLPDASFVDMIPVIGLIIPIVVIGLWPSILTDVFRVGIQAALH